MKNLNYREKLEKLKEITQNTFSKITNNKDELRKFLTLQAKLYKYSFEDVVAIYSQTPDATACATMDEWNKIGRRVNRGATATYAFTDDNQKEMKKVFDLESTHGRAFTYPVSFEIPTQQRQALLQFLGTNFATEVVETDFVDIFKFSLAEYVYGNYENYFNDFQYDKKDSLAELLNKMELDKAFKTAALECTTFMICEKFNIPNEEYKRNNLYFDSLILFDSKIMMTHIGHTANYISKSVITQINATLKQERSKENERKLELSRIDIDERGIYVNGEYEKTPMAVFGSELGTSASISSENRGGTNGAVEGIGRERNEHDAGVGGSPHTGIRGEIDATGALGALVPDVHGGQPPEPKIAPINGGRMGQDVLNGEQPSRGNGGTTGSAIQEQQPAPDDHGLHDATTMGNRQERLDRGNHLEANSVREEIDYQNWLKQQKAKEPFNTEGSFFNGNLQRKNEPYVIIEASESDYFKVSETLSFYDADKKFKVIEKQYRQQRLENGQTGGYKKTRGTIFFQENASDTEMSSYAFRYDIGDYDELHPGLYNHINNFWNNAEKKLQEQAETGQWQPYSQSDIDQVRNTLSILKPFCFETVAEKDNHNLNMDCAIGIEKAIDENFNGTHLNADTAKIVIAQFGQERVNFVLANTIFEKDYDGRFSSENKVAHLPKAKIKAEVKPEPKEIKILGPEFVEILEDEKEVEPQEQPKEPPKINPEPTTPDIVDAWELDLMEIDKDSFMS